MREASLRQRPPPSVPVCPSELQKRKGKRKRKSGSSCGVKVMVTLKAGSRPPWVGLGAAVWVQIASGNAYTFPLYSHSLKSVLGFNQHQLTMLGVANDIGENVGLLPGVVCNKFPPWVVLSIGAFACFLGYGVLWLALSRTLLSLPFWLVSSLLSVFSPYFHFLKMDFLHTHLAAWLLHDGFF